jgi:hypothetical protein
MDSTNYSLSRAVLVVKKKRFSRERVGENQKYPVKNLLNSEKI